ncbi:hypothetical protein AMS68_004684 [Peltaster fructicola]|uniref:Uncharacterized protein n=1 Tax=Peltaster fructicola TaxID=286661 RepID=A0A6H0XWM3_9PEZI|nr:hypothetical protein AMS68_004684 [Peltaster fructicola]
MSDSPVQLDIGPEFSWAAIGIAVLTAILQGLVAAMTFMTESSGQWTFRFRLALIEHYWWTFVALMLFGSLIMSVLAFVSGRGGDPVSVLALSSATFLAVIQYALPAWQQRHYTKTRWLAWTGDSRTAIKKDSISIATYTLRLLWLEIMACPGITPDPTDIFRVVRVDVTDLSDAEKADAMVGIFEPHDAAGKTVSFLWGRQQGFRPRLSRAVMSMPLTLLNSSPLTTDGYNGRGLTIAMGILGRNKGLQPWKLVFKLSSELRDLMEATSTWTPRPAKVLRTFYQHTMRAQYSGLGEDYVNAAVELALLLVDIPNHAIDLWLTCSLEHQSISINNLLLRRLLSACTVTERNAVLCAHYESSYAAMIMSLNSMDPAVKASRKGPRLTRPDLVFTALMSWKREIRMEHLWRQHEAQDVLRQEVEKIEDQEAWKAIAAGLVGLDGWPAELDCVFTADEKVSSLPAWRQKAQLRCFRAAPSKTKIPDFAFAFDIDGVLLRSSTPIPKASETLKLLQQQGIPFILLTNGGGKTEEARVADLSEKLEVPLDTSLFVQSHTPFKEFVDEHDKTVLVVGGDADKCAEVARSYGHKNVVTPGDILVSHPDVWPFSQNFLDYYRSFARPLPKPINPTSPEDSLKIDTIYVYNDPRDWGLDSTIMLDLLLSREGILGTLSTKNGNEKLPNRGYLQDGQPEIHYSNPDMFWAASHRLPRLGQGGFISSFNGLWSAVTGGASLNSKQYGKPHRATYVYAERQLVAHRKALFGPTGLNHPLRRVYMIGDNPLSDIRGANTFHSPTNSSWSSILVRTGVYNGGTPAEIPTHIADDVSAAVQWAIKDSKWKL